MPFKSSAQLRTCFSKKVRASSSSRSVPHSSRSVPHSSSKWDCDKWLKETPKPECLPSRVNGSVKCRPIRVGEPIIGPVITGPRGGKYFMVAGIKIALPRNYKLSNR